MGLFGSLLKLTVDVVVAPVAIAKDVVTLGGAAIDKPSATGKKLDDIKEDLEELYKH